MRGEADAINIYSGTADKNWDCPAKPGCMVTLLRTWGNPVHTHTQKVAEGRG